MSTQTISGPSSLPKKDTNKSQNSKVENVAIDSQITDVTPLVKTKSSAADELFQSNSKMEKIQQCLQEHSGQGKCNVKLNVDNDLDIDLSNFAGMFLDRKSAFPSLFNTNINLKVEGGMECSKLVKCIIDTQRY